MTEIRDKVVPLPYSDPRKALFDFFQTLSEEKAKLMWGMLSESEQRFVAELDKQSKKD